MLLRIITMSSIVRSSCKTKMLPCDRCCSFGCSVPNVEKYLRDEVDTNGDEVLDENEIRTLVAIMRAGRVPVTGSSV